VYAPEGTFILWGQRYRPDGPTFISPGVGEHLRTSIEMNTQNDLIIRFSKRKIALLLIGCILFVSLGILMILSPETFSSRRYGNPKEILFIVGSISTVFFTPFLFSILFKLLDNKPGLRITKDGVYENSGGAPIGFVEWNDVTEITSMGDQKNMIILIHVQNPNKYIDREPNIFKRWIMKNNYKYY
jgi:hypothetical protein